MKTCTEHFEMITGENELKTAHLKEARIQVKKIKNLK